MPPNSCNHLYNLHMLNAADLDATDPLVSFRDRFVISDPGLIYLDGNSLGRMPKAAAEIIKRTAEKEWASDLVRGWGEWINLPERLGAKIAKLIGAEPDEVIVSDSTTVNLFKLVYAALKLDPRRTTVVTDDLNFPSDVYAISGVLDLIGTGYKLDIIPSRDQISIGRDQIESSLNDEVALLTLSHTSFKSGFVHDMAAVTALAHSKAVPVLWDLSHSVGAVPVDLNAAGADLAIGCTYKYLNGGPGAPAFLYVRRDLQEKLRNPIWGWFGQTRPFDFDLNYAARKGISKFMVGTPPILSMAAVEAGVDIVIAAGIEKTRTKSVLQTEFLVQLWSEHLQPFGVQLKSPLDKESRGAHVSFAHPEALRIDKCLIEEMNVVPDFRAPDSIRYGASPLYNSFSELEEAVLRLKRVIRDKAYEKYSADKPAVT